MLSDLTHKSPEEWTAFIHPKYWTSVRLSSIANSIYPYTFDRESVPTVDPAVLESSTSPEHIFGSQEEERGPHGSSWGSRHLDWLRFTFQ